MKIEGCDAEKFDSSVRGIARKVEIIVVTASQREDIPPISIAASHPRPDLYLLRSSRSPGAETKFAIFPTFIRNSKAILKDHSIAQRLNG
jgi:hypothetical protein